MSKVLRRGNVKLQSSLLFDSRTNQGVGSLVRTAEVALSGLVTMNRTMGLHELMRLDQGPPLASRDAFYGQSVTVTGLLLERGTPEQLLRFVKVGQRHGYEQALREIYAIESWSELESQWQTFARSQRLRLLAHHSISAANGKSNSVANPLQLTVDSR